MEQNRAECDATKLFASRQERIATRKNYSLRHSKLAIRLERAVIDQRYTHDQKANGHREGKWAEKLKSGR